MRNMVNNTHYEWKWKTIAAHFETLAAYVRSRQQASQVNYRWLAQRKKRALATAKVTFP